MSKENGKHDIYKEVRLSKDVIAIVAVFNEPLSIGRREKVHSQITFKNNEGKSLSFYSKADDVTTPSLFFPNKITLTQIEKELIPNLKKNIKNIR